MYGVTPAIVLYARDPVVTRQFYETVGLDFVEETHGDGPVHYACDFQGIALEIYPLPPGRSAAACNTVALIFFVDRFDGVVAGLRAMDAKIGTVGVYVESAHLRAVNVRAPEGLLVRLLERDPSVVQ